MRVGESAVSNNPSQSDRSGRRNRRANLKEGGEVSPQGTRPSLGTYLAASGTVNVERRFSRLLARAFGRKGRY